MVLYPVDPYPQRAIRGDSDRLAGAGSALAMQHDVATGERIQLRVARRPRRRAR